MGETSGALANLWPVVVAGLILLVAFVVYAVVVGPRLRRLRRQRSSNARLLAEGVFATATVISARQTGSSIESGGFQSFEVTMQLQVEPRADPAFVAVATTFINVLDLGKAQPGAAAVVRYDADEKSQAVITNLLGPLSTMVRAEGLDPEQAHQLVLDSELLQDELTTRGVEAAAIVRDSQRTGIVLFDGAADLVRLSLTVQRADGPSYQAETTAAIVTSALHKVRPGAGLTVRYDPEQPSRVAVARLPA